MRIEIKDGVALVSLEAPKANSMGPGFVDAMMALLDELEASPPDAAVLTGKGRVFSAGLDIPSLLAFSREELGAFMTRFDEMMIRVFTLPFPVLAAVNGHAVAGGCVLAMQADERWMARGDPKIGLTEVTLGIGLPTFVYESFASQVGPEATLKGAQQGALFSPEEALALGIVHALEDADDVVECTRARARSLLDSAGPGYAQVKALRRRGVLERTRANADADLQGWLDTWFSSRAQEQLQAVAARLKR